MYDLIVRNGDVIDGSGRPAYRADIGVMGDRIVALGGLGEAQAKREIDAAGKAVSPGFIDIHSHSDATVLLAPRMESKLRQGVTLEVTGNCGESAAPLRGEALEDARRSLARDGDVVIGWRSLGEYLDTVERRGIATNYATLVGQGTIRACVIGAAMRAPGAAELETMRDLVRASMEEGAFGLSSGLIYPPSSYADTEELVALSSAMESYGGFYATHLRSEGDLLLESVQEAFEIGRRAGVAVQLSHHKASGPRNWGKVGESLGMIEKARASGLDVTADQYPYVASSTGLGSILPEWAHDGGAPRLVERLRESSSRDRIRAEVAASHEGWDDPAASQNWDSVVVSGCRSDPSLEGLGLAEIGRKLGRHPIDAALDLLAENGASVQVVMFTMCEPDVRAVMSSPFVAVGSDSTARAPSGPMSGAKPHPRCYGTFPRVIGRYARELGVIPLEEAVRKMTGLPAGRLGLKDRGLLREGAYADLVVFDPAAIADRATFADPHRFPEGISAVLVNGVVAVEGGRQTEALAGKVLRRGRD